MEHFITWKLRQTFEVRRKGMECRRALVAMVIIVTIETCGCAQNSLPVSDGAAVNELQQTTDGHVVKKNREGMEEEILGPLRIWHIAFIVSSILLIALTVLCCCVDFRIPRTRQEIEETYRTRRMNEKYLHQLERTPDVILRQSASATRQDEEPSRNRRFQDIARSAAETRAAPSTSNGNTRHHQERRHNNPSSSRANTDRSSAQNIGAAESDNARLARITKSRLYGGVQTPFALSAAELMRQHKPHPRQQPKQQQQQPGRQQTSQQPRQQHKPKRAQEGTRNSGQASRD